MKLNLIDTGHLEVNSLRRHRTGSRPNKHRKYAMWLPYGVYICADGVEYLYNRYYEPILRREKGVVTRCGWGVWVNNIKDQKWFYSDRNSPWWQDAASCASLKMCTEALREWGFEFTKRRDLSPETLQPIGKGEGGGNS